jgi:hypothetical protein
MKKLMFAFCFFFGGLVAVNAQDTTSTDTQNQQQYPTTQGDQDRERINSRDLPDAVKRSLEGTEYRGWLVNAAYKTQGVESSSDTTNAQGNQDTQQGNQGNQTDSTSVSGSEQSQSGAYGQEVFVVELKNGAQTKTVRFDKDGKKLDDGGMKEDDQK